MATDVRNARLIPARPSDIFAKTCDYQGVSYDDNQVCTTHTWMQMYKAAQFTGLGGVSSAESENAKGGTHLVMSVHRTLRNMIF